MIKIPRMVPFRCDRCDATHPEHDTLPAHGGGVIIYAHQKWSPFISVCEFGSKVSKDFEVVSICINKPNNRKMFLMCLYKPPTGSVDELLTFLRDVLSNPDVSRSEIWLLGGFNVNILIRNDIHVMTVNRFLKEFGLKQLITELTRLMSRGGSCIDWIITNSSIVKHSGVLDELLSDHFPIFVVRKKNREAVVEVWKNVFSIILTGKIFCYVKILIDYGK